MGAARRMTITLVQNVTIILDKENESNAAMSQAAISLD